NSVLVQDEVQADQPVDMTWNFHTDAKIEIVASRSAATLTRGGVELTVSIVSPPGAAFTAAPADAPPPQAKNKNVTNLSIALKQITDTRIVVRFTANPTDAADLSIKPLSDWVSSVENAGGQK